ncbi:MAG: hypothetical protein D6715_00720 [Calditrichaeota bacterium]|nr:MAG: hypothetical protein D6715_00720 [Calditrichota bacterium]
MPVFYWKHQCPEANDFIVFYPFRECPLCGTSLSEPYEWRLTPDELEERYERFWGLKIKGPHRKFMDRVFKNKVKICPVCQGGCILTVWGDLIYWDWCALCDGLGHLKTISEKRFKSLRKRVLDRYPDAVPVILADNRYRNQQYAAPRDLQLDPRKLSAAKLKELLIADFLDDFFKGLLNDFQYLGLEEDEEALSDSSQWDDDSDNPWGIFDDDEDDEPDLD